MVYRTYDFVMDSDKYIKFKLRTNGFDNPNYCFHDQYLALIHVPKTGGSSFYKMLKNDPMSRFINLGIHKPVSLNNDPETHRYITIIRDPVDRVWSQYQHTLRIQHEPYRKFARRGLSVFLKKCWLAQNLYCKYYTGMIDLDADEAMLKQALINLNNFHEIIWFNEFAAHVREFMSKYEIPYEVIPNERNSDNPDPQPEELDLIRSYNKYDIKLYETWRNKNINID